MRDAVPRLYREWQVRGTDRLMRWFYDGLPRLHDPAVRWVLPLLQGGSEQSLRDGYLPELDLTSLVVRPDGAPPRILEVGVGTGANLPQLWREVPPGLPVDVWGVDLSAGMLARCASRVRTSSDRARASQVRLLMADAHRLPFADATFDRVFHVGAAGSFADPRRALAEMARVAVPGTPVVVVDEQLDPTSRHGLLRRAAFGLLTFYDRDPHCPRELVPPGATDVREKQVSRFYYCLRFRTPMRVPPVLRPSSRHGNVSRKATRIESSGESP